ncbi:PadR family transcriptional regulator [Actinoplanes sp. NBRC 103695]|uniref:PadR family transcriptional regulator n=1 Tax=Actinoplanes sp. NBRC 103695 TaxID=3032202 RepID=UPI0024A31590|nr:PadR family transcriptional regulator [Actinoplanes sp. NBRC 103695]GLY98902.1 PadR family transcriptional regulator [Actinoplanes sp. NBRC 103695]
MTDTPMREPTFLVLTALAAGPQHGYAVIEDVATMTGGRVKLRAGTLYAALDRLRGDGLIEVDREEIVQSRLRRYYRLSASGARALASESARLREQAAIAEKRLRARGVSGAVAPVT